MSVKDEINALNLANLVGDMIRTEQGEVHRNNETDLFKEKQDLGAFADFPQKVSKMTEVRTAREVLALREAKKKQLENLSSHNKSLKTALNYNPNEKK